MATEHGMDGHCAINLKNSRKPRTILLFSGKRKCGKDFITNILQERIGNDRSVIVRLSGPIKTHWAKSMGLDIDQLLGDGQYKENYRLQMAKWGENVRKKDYGYFCREAVDMYNAHSKAVWIISDVRRRTDIQWFLENFNDACKTIRIETDDLIRQKRGWTFTPGCMADTKCVGHSVLQPNNRLASLWRENTAHCNKLYLNVFPIGIDDSETECDLDDVEKWDLRVTNNDDNIECILQQILQLIN